VPFKIAFVVVALFVRFVMDKEEANADEESCLR